MSAVWSDHNEDRETPVQPYLSDYKSVYVRGTDLTDPDKNNDQLSELKMLREEIRRFHIGACRMKEEGFQEHSFDDQVRLMILHSPVFDPAKRDLGFCVQEMSGAEAVAPDFTNEKLNAYCTRAREALQIMEQQESIMKSWYRSLNQDQLNIVEGGADEETAVSSIEDPYTGGPTADSADMAMQNPQDNRPRPRDSGRPDNPPYSPLKRKKHQWW